ncbi:domain and endonuclease exonuclease phosphatase family protein [Stylonychia lemnae]|uniref:phosphoinositide 5-phosphatase n=1 Tax=Stylonychia lemnae TaxID=5949 RepID=A0A078BC96_STYLE|nr:domain and endonuclease exonuclease phosphatase family protein [Stylonychia lemnae]|eukprot:CDW90862.1 domain and endonuclease exonuclease phosphatase family protein [Stylonychia lemnae]
MDRTLPSLNKAASQVEYVDYDSPVWALQSTPNTFTISPLKNVKFQKSLIIDKNSVKIQEHDVVVRQDADWTLEIQGFLGIINILGLEHLMVITGKEEICRIKHRFQIYKDEPTSIYELQDIDIIPFYGVNNNHLENSLKSIREGIKRYMEAGFYFSYNFDLTLSAQKRDKLYFLSDGQDLKSFDPLSQQDYRYVWNYNLNKQMRTQHISQYWTIPIIQGFVGQSEINDIELILLSRRRWIGGGSKNHCRGLDEEGNTACSVETEQLIFYKVQKDKTVRFFTTSYVQLRATAPLFWQQLTGKPNMMRSVESTLEIFTKHVMKVCEDYEVDKFLALNLQSQSQAFEDELTQHYKKIIDETAPTISKQGKKIDYDHFDYAHHCKKNTSVLDTYINDMLKNKYLDSIDCYTEKHSIYYENDQIVRESRSILKLQKGLVRTNCLDCSDKSNVVQMKLCYVSIIPYLKQTDPKIEQVFTTLWQLNGEYLSKQYTGQSPQLNQILSRDHLMILLNIGNMGPRRMLRQNLSDEYRQECFLIFQGSHELCNTIPSTFIESTIIKEIKSYTEEQKVVLHITTINCAGRLPSSYKELIPIFKPQIDGVFPDIMVIGLQEIVKLNAFGIFKGKNKTRMNEWEQLLRSAIEVASNTKDPMERYVWVIAKSMVGCFIGLFVKRKLLEHNRIKDLMATKIKTGLGGSAGNKGAVIVRFKLDDTNMMFLNCHLMSGKGKGSKRTDEINFIFDNAFKTESKSRRLGFEHHDMVFLFGDLNYRIAATNDLVRPAVKKLDYRFLKANDELMQAFELYRHSKDMQYRFYRDFIEGNIDFPPTYKFDKKSNEYDSSKKQRVPAWCDRILWKRNSKVNQQILKSIQDILFSDHRPVFAQFEIYSSKINHEKVEQVEEQLFENTRFQSLYVFGKQKSMPIPQVDVNDTQLTKEQADDQNPIDMSQPEVNLDKSLSKNSKSEPEKQYDQIVIEKADNLVPLIEENDDDDDAEESPQQQEKKVQQVENPKGDVDDDHSGESGESNDDDSQNKGTADSNNVDQIKQEQIQNEEQKQQ